tara:strand:- start:37576 stop:38244 length:669 start_codon:yes stop_codon:yes gene_type:complete
MSISLPELPYHVDALEPYISAATVGFHYGKHHAGYVARSKQLLAQSELNGLAIEDLIRVAHTRGMTALFNNVAQVWSHSFYWQSLHPEGGGEPHGAIAALIEIDFVSNELFLERLRDAATNFFGSGWVWVVLNKDRLDIMRTSNADNPLVHNQVPLLAIDVWEHAYYLDRQNNRAAYVRGVLDHLINWRFANENLESALKIANTRSASLTGTSSEAPSFTLD